MLIDLVSRSNSWAKEWQCGQGNCAPCEGRLMLAAEEEKEAIDLAYGDGKPRGRKDPDLRKAIPSCTGDGVNYSVECVTCRQEGKRRI